MGVNTAQTPETVNRNASALEVWKLNATGIADHNMLYIALTIDQHADLPVSFVRKLAKLARKLWRDDLVR
jgi:hypothetical protein